MTETNISSGSGRSEQRRQRRALLPLAYGKACPYCGHPMLEGQKLDLDHWPPRMFAGRGLAQHQQLRITHAYCNRRAGQKLNVLVRKRRAMARRSRW
jgi:hypothetical protein